MTVHIDPGLVRNSVLAIARAGRRSSSRRGLIPTHHLLSLDITWFAPGVLGSVVRSLAVDYCRPQIPTFP